MADSSALSEPSVDASRPRILRSTGIAQTFVVGTLLLCICSIPSCVLAPVNVLLKYLACVAIYPSVRLTWPGVASCVPDLWILLQTNVYATVLVMYFVLWCLWPGRVKICKMFKPPLNTMKKCRSGWNSLLEHTRVRAYQQGFCAWGDVQWLWYVSSNGHAAAAWQSVPSVSLRRLFSNSTWKPSSWKGVTRTVYHLHVQVHALFWRVTSYHIRLHLRIWLLLVERMFCRCFSNKELFTAGRHVDVLKQHKVQFLLMRRLPLRALSRWWGRLCQLELPIWLRRPAYRLYIRIYGCKLDEALITDLTSYRNMSQFFRRSLKPHLRPTDRSHCLTSPADGRVLFLGRVEEGVVEQVKGVTYSLRYFMGQDHSFMQLFMRDSQKTTRRATDEQSYCLDNNETNIPFVSDFCTKSKDPAADDPETYDLLRKRDTEQVCVGEVPSYGVIPRLLHEGKNVQFHSSVTRNNISFEHTQEDGQNEAYHLEEVIYEQVFRIDDCGKALEQAAHRRITSCQPPGLHYMATAAPSDDKHLILKQEADFAAGLILNTNHVLHEFVVYLAPGDYHRFHSPTDWTVYCRRHFPGNLFSVNPNTARWLQGLFVINERVLYIGRWKYGFFSMTAVGATNVGSINVLFDETLQTNVVDSEADRCTYNETTFSSRSGRGVSLKRGQLMGDFNLGSTVVLLFEAPSDFTFRSQIGDVVRYGQGLTKPTKKTRPRQRRHKRKLRKH